MISHSFFPVTVIGSRRRMELRLPAEVPVGELLGELVVLLDEPVDGPPPRWGLMRLGGHVLDAGNGLATQRIPAGAMLFLRDLGVAEPPAVVDDYASAVAATVESSPGLWTPARLHGLFVVAAAAWVLGAGVVDAAGVAGGRGLTLPTRSSALLAIAVALGAIAVGRVGRAPWTGVLLALAALPLWAAAGFGIAVTLAGPHSNAEAAGALIAVAVGCAAAAAVADQGVPFTIGVATAAMPWALTLAACVRLGYGVATGAAVLAPLALTALRFWPVAVVRLLRLDDQTGVSSLRSPTVAARRALEALTAGTAITLAGVCVVLAAQTTWWASALAFVVAVAALLQGRRRRFILEVAPLWLVPLATLAAFELRLPLDWKTQEAMLVGTGGVLVPLGLLASRVELPPSARRQLERLEALAVAAVVPLTIGLLGVYDAVAKLAGRFG